MPDKPNDTPAQSQVTSLTNQAGSNPPHLDLDVVLQCLTQTETRSSPNCEDVVILLAILRGMSSNMLSSDAVWLSCHHAKQLCISLGIDEDAAEQKIAVFMDAAKNLRSQHPMASMFD